MTSHVLPRMERTSTVFVFVSVAAAAILAFVVVAGGSEPAVDEPLGGAPASSVGPGISVSDALASTAEGPLLVNGFLYVDVDGTVYLAEMLAESLPPQISVESSFRVVGLDPATVAELSTAQGISWTDSVIQVLGDVKGSTLTVSTTSM